MHVVDANFQYEAHKLDNLLLDVHNTHTLLHDFLGITCKHYEE